MTKNPAPRGQQAPTLQRLREHVVAIDEAKRLPQRRVEIIPDHEVARNQITAVRWPWTPQQVAEMLLAHFAVESVEVSSVNDDVVWAGVTLDDGQRFRLRVERAGRLPNALAVRRTFDDRA